MVKKNNLALAVNTRKELKIDLGCGERRPDEKQFGKDWTGIDISPDCGAEMTLDLTQYPWPFEDNAVDEIYSSHFFEHLDGMQRIALMEECFRVLRPKCKMTIVVPYWSSMRSIQDPFHKWPPIAETSFLYFNKGWREKEKLSHYPIKCDFDFGYGYGNSPDLNGRNDEYRMMASKNYVNSVWDLIITLTSRKEPNA